MGLIYRSKIWEKVKNTGDACDGSAHLSCDRAAEVEIQGEVKVGSMGDTEKTVVQVEQDFNIY